MAKRSDREDMNHWMHVTLCGAFRYSDLLVQSKADHADITDESPPSLPIMLFDNECVPGEP
jgi:hypothetical protein